MKDDGYDITKEDEIGKDAVKQPPKPVAPPPARKKIVALPVKPEPLVLYLAFRPSR